MLVDLHIHSNNSDGSLSPEEIFKISSKMGLNLMSITDHDYISNYSYLSNKYGVMTVTGIEFNTSHKKLHILGYDIKDIYTVNKIMNELSKYNEGICFKVIDLLSENGFNISVNKVLDFCKKNNINQNVINKKIIVKYLISMGYASSVKDAYDSLIGRDAEFYVPIHKLEPKEVIELINNTGGVSVWAHPSNMQLIIKDNLLEILTSYGLNGIEITKKDFEISNSMCELIASINNLITTYGSDFHGYDDEIGLKISDEKGKKLIKEMGVKLC